MKLMAIIRIMKSVQCHPAKKPPSGSIFLWDTTGYSTWVEVAWETYACWAFLVLSSIMYLTVISWDCWVWGCVSLILKSKLWAA